MSRVGSSPIKTNNVKIEITEGDSRFGGQTVKVNGTKGDLEVHLRPDVIANLADDEISVTMTEFGEKNKSNNLWGLSRTLIANAVEGVTNGYSKELEIIGIGYRVEQQGSNLKFNLGYNNLIEFPVPEGISIEIKDGAEITVSGIDKQLVGETAASIRRLRPPEPYKGKGIRYKDEYVKIKVGKSAA